jgi:hypothetical protein
MQHNSIQEECKQDRNPDYMQHGKMSIDVTVGCQWSWMFTLLHNTHTHAHVHAHTHPPR